MLTLAASQHHAHGRPAPTSDAPAMQAPGRAMQITWQPPQAAGHPPFHKYKLQRTSDPDGLSEWSTVNRQVDVDAASWIDRNLQVLPYASMPQALAPASDPGADYLSPLLCQHTHKVRNWQQS